MAARLLRALHALLLLARAASEEFGADGAEERVLAQDVVARDMVSISMFRVFERYREEPQSSRRDGNTVRSFRAAPRESPGHQF